MALKHSAEQLFQGFSKLSRMERYQALVKMGALTEDDVRYFTSGKNLKTELAEKLVENVIGYFHLPLGVATNLKIDGKDYVIPMAVEETSIIAALSKTAKWIRRCGEIKTEIIGDTLIGQIQIAHVKNFDKLKKSILVNKSYLINLVNEGIASGLVRRGGGAKDIIIRKIKREDGQLMAVLHILVDCCDAMGANILNQICETLKLPIENCSGEKVTICILSNLNDRKLTCAKVIIKKIDPDLGRSIEEASLFAQHDPYRAATNNKGVLNGIDPILIATGNDWRAVEAGIHAYACRNGQYQSITDWRMEKQNLVGTFKAPLIVGTVGGVTQLHPTAKLCLNMLKVKHANDLSRIIAAAGLVQNLGALCALATEGVVQGHMKLHINNLTLSAGANEDEFPVLKKRLEEFLKVHKRISLSHAVELLKELRRNNLSSAKQRTAF